MNITNNSGRAILSIVVLIVLVIIFGWSVCYFYKISMQKYAISKLKSIQAELIQASRYSAMVHNEDIGVFETDMPVNLFAEKYFTPYLNIITFCKGVQDNCWNSPQYTDLKGRPYFNKALYSVVLNDGAVIGFNKDKNNIVTILVDTNGKVKPNRLGKDVFIFSIYNTEKTPGICEKSEYETHVTYNGIHPGGVDKCGIPHDTYTYNELISENFEDGCNKKSLYSKNSFGAGTACLTILKLNAWIIDKKYPW